MTAPADQPPIIGCLLKAFELPIDEPLDPRPDRAWFQERLLINSQSNATQAIVRRAVDEKRVVFRSVWHPLTVCEIETNLLGWPNPQVRLIEPKPSVAWRWKYWYPAFSFFWAFIFHTENQWLRRPALIWKELDRHACAFIGTEQHAYAQKDAEWQYYLALYERILGVISDIEHEQLHYITNVVSRQGLKPEEIRERPKLFRTAVDYLLKRLEERLLD